MDLKRHLQRYLAPGTAEHAKCALAFLVVVVQTGSISESADDDGRGVAAIPAVTAS